MSNCCSTSKNDDNTIGATMPASQSNLLDANLLGTTLLGTTVEQLAECPVMPGSTVVIAEAEAAGLFRDVEGQRYWFCCAGCGPRFDANPAQYISAA